MKKQFTDYLSALGLSATLIQRVEEFHGYYENLCSEELAGIFVTDFIESGDTRIFENLWFFSENYIMEVKNFSGDYPSFDLSLLKQIYYWEIKSKDYDFNTATNDSRINLEVKFQGLIGANFKAAKNNCDFLKNIFMTHIKVNMST